jgi:hypothetical protein
MVWYRNPVEFFNSDRAGDFDMYFQDDGARTARYAPYSPNSGFYFVRFNERTSYFFSVFLRMGDLIQAGGSHQSALTSIMSEHTSWRGLKVKVLGRSSDEGRLFPGGFHYHKDKRYMKGFLSGTIEQPYIFHMSWTTNKDNKRLFLQQLGAWYVKKRCELKTRADIRGDYLSTCCSAKPIVKCHFKDKPSKIPCKKSPSIDKGRRSFW